jgi:hypothetical protein
VRPLIPYSKGRASGRPRQIESEGVISRRDRQALLTAYIVGAQGYKGRDSKADPRFSTNIMAMPATAE